MKTAEEILNDHYPLDFINERIKEIVLKAMKEYAQDVAREALRNASKVADKLRENGDLVKEIILNESNIPSI